MSKQAHLPDGTVLDFPDNTNDEVIDRAVKAHVLATKENQVHGQPGYGVLAQQGITLGLSDEAAGVGGVISGLLHGDTNVSRNYQVNRDAERERIAQARQNTGAAGKAVEIVSSLGSGGAAGAPITSMKQATVAGAQYGATAGFGYGRGLKESTIGAATGAATGAALGAVGYKAGEAVGKRSAAKAAAQSTVQTHAAQLDQANHAEGGGMLNRAMVDPALQNKVTQADASGGGGAIVQQGMRDVQGKVEANVAGLGAGGQRMAPQQAGQTIQDAADRWIKATGSQGTTGAKYTRAAQLAGDTKIMPVQSVQQIDGLIGDLAQTPNTNAAEIKFLQGLKADLSQGLSVDALRTIRTQLRGRITGNDLTFGANEARVLGIMDSASTDLTNGLIAAGKPQAAQAYQAADTAYRARQDYINTVLKKVVGGRNATPSPERVFGTVQSMAKGKDAIGLRKLYATFTPEERSDFAATFASELGKNNKGDFTLDQFVNQTNQFSGSALETIFGKDGAQSVQNLRLLSKEGARVQSAMNSRTSKSGIAANLNYRGWLRNLVLGGLGGAGGTAVGGPVGGGLGAAAMIGGEQALRTANEAWVAKALMSPKITRWLNTAPSTINPAAINAHFAKLATIAKLEPTLEPVIEKLRQAVFSVANDNAARIGSAAASPDQGPDQQQQGSTVLPPP